MSKESRALTYILKLISAEISFTFCVGTVDTKIANKLTRQGFLKRQYVFANYIEYTPTKQATPLFGLETNNSRLNTYKSIKHEPVFPTI